MAMPVVFALLATARLVLTGRPVVAFKLPLTCLGEYLLYPDPDPDRVPGGYAQTCRTLPRLLPLVVLSAFPLVGAAALAPDGDPFAEPRRRLVAVLIHVLIPPTAFVFSFLMFAAPAIASLAVALKGGKR